jgi:phosphatidylglycerol:prolipoprotein diacylglycerol transferase
MERQALVVTHVVPETPWAPGLTGHVRYTGQGPGPHDRFERWYAIEHLPAGGGPYSLTSVIYDVAPGEWDVAAELAAPADGGGLAPASTLAPAAWSWRRWSIAPTTSMPIASRWAPLAPLARMPAVLPGAWATLCALAALLALAIVIRGGASAGLPAASVLSVTVIAVVAGLVGARAWYAYLNPTARLFPGGWAVDGFLVAAPVGAVAAAFGMGVPVASYLDVATPALFMAVAVARIGCFLAGCCAGRISTSRWAIWSSDHRLGARRVPTQALESVAGGILAVLAAAALPLSGGTGLVFVVGIAAYAAVRQLLLRSRAEARTSSWRRAATPRPSFTTATVPAPAGPIPRSGLDSDGLSGR